MQKEWNLIWFLLGIHGFLGLVLTFAAVGFLVIGKYFERISVILSIFILGLVNVYYVLYYSGLLVYCPVFLGVYPWIGILGHIFLYHGFLEIFDIRNIYHKYTLFHSIIPIAEGIRITYIFKLSDFSEMGFYNSNLELMASPEIFPDELSLWIFAIVSLFYILRTFFLFGSFSNKGMTLKGKIAILSIQSSLLFIYIGWIFSQNPILHISLPILFSILIPCLLVLSLIFPYIHQLGLVIPADGGFSFPKYSKSSLKNIDLKKLDSKIEVLVEEKFYLEEDCSLPKVSKLCEVSTHQLSEFFNMIKGVRYSDYIKKLRVNESIHLIQEYPNWNLTRIGMESGFQSTSSFYESFKKEIGITPKEYRKKFPKTIPIL